MDLEKIILAIIGSNVVSAIVGAWFARRKTDADASHSAVDAAGDAVKLLRETFVDRIDRQDDRIATLEKERQEDRQEIIRLNRRLGEIMQAAEWQSIEISRLQKEIDLWRGRVDELLCIFRENEWPLPAWAHGQSA